MSDGRSDGLGAPVNPTQAEHFVVRIVSLDYHLAAPLPGVDVAYSHFAGEAVEQVPVVRIFGSTPAGQRCCLHLHKAFPYFYVPYDEDLPSDPPDVQMFLRRLGLGLDTALNRASQVPGPSRQHVFGMLLVRGTPFYGYHAHEKVWVKIMMYDPRDVGRAASLLQSGAVLGRRFQPHESHVPYLLQFKVDFNLYGMGFLRLAKALFRHPLPEAHSRDRPGWAQQHVVQHVELGGISETAGSQSMREWTAGNTPAVMQWGVGQPGPAPQRHSTCHLECDACVEDILNKAELVRLPLPQAGPEVRMVESLAPMWEEERQRCGGSLPDPPPDPPRTPQLLSHAVTAVRQEFQAIADLQQQLMPASPHPSASQPQPTPAATPSGEPATPAGPRLTPGGATGPPPSPLLRLTQAANKTRAAAFATPFTAGGTLAAPSIWAGHPHRHPQQHQPDSQQPSPVDPWERLPSPQAARPAGPGGSPQQPAAVLAAGAAAAAAESVGGALAQTPAATRGGAGPAGWGSQGEAEGLVDEDILTTQLAKWPRQGSGLVDDVEVARWVEEEARRRGCSQLNSSSSSDDEVEEEADGDGDGAGVPAEEDLLMAMAEAAEEEQQQGPGVGCGSLPASQRQGWLPQWGRVPRSAQKQDPQLRALLKFERMLAASQRDCDAILDCAGEEPEVLAPGEGQDPSNLPPQHSPQQRPATTRTPLLSQQAAAQAALRLQYPPLPLSPPPPQPSVALMDLLGAAGPAQQAGHGTQQQHPQGMHSHRGHARSPQQAQHGAVADMEDLFGGSPDDDALYLEALQQYEQQVQHAQQAEQPQQRQLTHHQRAEQLVPMGGVGANQAACQEEGPTWTHPPPSPAVPASLAQHGAPGGSPGAGAPPSLCPGAGAASSDSDIPQTDGCWDSDGSGSGGSPPGPAAAPGCGLAQLAAAPAQPSHGAGETARTLRRDIYCNYFDGPCTSGQHCPPSWGGHFIPQADGTNDSSPSQLDQSQGSPAPQPRYPGSLSFVSSPQKLAPTGGAPSLTAAAAAGPASSASPSARYGALSFVSSSPNQPVASAATAPLPASSLPQAAAAAHRKPWQTSPAHPPTLAVKGLPRGAAGLSEQPYPGGRRWAQRRRRGMATIMLGGPAGQSSPTASEASASSMHSAGAASRPQRNTAGPADALDGRRGLRSGSCPPATAGPAGLAQQRQVALQPRVSGLRRPPASARSRAGLPLVRNDNALAPAAGSVPGQQAAAATHPPGRPALAAIPASTGAPLLRRPHRRSGPAASAAGLPAADETAAASAPEQQGGQGLGAGPAGARVVPGLLRPVALRKRRHGGSELVFADPATSKSCDAVPESSQERSSSVEPTGVGPSGRAHPLERRGSPGADGVSSERVRQSGPPPRRRQQEQQQEREEDKEEGEEEERGHAVDAGGAGPAGAQYPSSKQGLDAGEELQPPVVPAVIPALPQEGLLPPAKEVSPARAAGLEVSQPAAALPFPTCQGAYMGRDEVRAASRVAAATAALLLGAYDSASPGSEPSPAPHAAPDVGGSLSSGNPYCQGQGQQQHHERQQQQQDAEEDEVRPVQRQPALEAQQAPEQVHHRQEEGQEVVQQEGQGLERQTSFPPQPRRLSRDQVRASSQLLGAVRLALQGSPSSPSTTTASSQPSPAHSLSQSLSRHSPPLLLPAPLPAADAGAAPLEVGGGGGGGRPASGPGQQVGREGVAPMAWEGPGVVPDSPPMATNAHASPPHGQDAGEGAGTSPAAGLAAAGEGGTGPWPAACTGGAAVAGLPTAGAAASQGLGFQPGQRAAVDAAAAAGPEPGGVLGLLQQGSYSLPLVKARGGEDMEMEDMELEGQRQQQQEEEEAGGHRLDRLDSSGRLPPRDATVAQIDVAPRGAPGAANGSTGRQAQPGHGGGHVAGADAEVAPAAAPAAASAAALLNADADGPCVQPQDPDCMEGLEPAGEPPTHIPRGVVAPGHGEGEAGGQSGDGGGGDAQPAGEGAREEDAGEEPVTEEEGEDAVKEWWREASQVSFGGYDDDWPMFDLDSDWAEGHGASDDDHADLGGAGPAEEARGPVVEGAAPGGGAGGVEAGEGGGDDGGRLGPGDAVVIPRELLLVFRPRKPPPSQGELDATAWQHGVAPVVHQAAHYGSAADVPDRPPVFAGQEFRVPSASVEDLAPFRPGNGQTDGRSSPLRLLRARHRVAHQQQQLASVQQHPKNRPRLLAFAFAKPPPSRAQTDAWLSKRRASRKRRRLGAAGGDRGEAAAAEGGFAMDANTGKLVPTTAMAAVAAAAGRGGGSQECGDDDLLGTPWLCTQASGRRATAPQYSGGDMEDSTPPGSRDGGSAGEEEEEEEGVRPASPKYDQRNFFFSLPAATQPSGRAHTQRRRGPATQLAFPATTVTPTPPRLPPAAAVPGIAGSGGKEGRGRLAEGPLTVAAAPADAASGRAITVEAEVAGEGRTTVQGLSPFSRPLPALRTDFSTREPAGAATMPAAPRPPATGAAGRTASVAGESLLPGVGAAPGHRSSAGGGDLGLGYPVPGLAMLQEEEGEQEELVPTQEVPPSVAEPEAQPGVTVLADISPSAREQPLAQHTGSQPLRQPSLLKSVLKSALKSTAARAGGAGLGGGSGSDSGGAGQRGARGSQPSQGSAGGSKKVGFLNVPAPEEPPSPLLPTQPSASQLQHPAQQQESTDRVSHRPSPSGITPAAGAAAAAAATAAAGGEVGPARLVPPPPPAPPPAPAPAAAATTNPATTGTSGDGSSADRRRAASRGLVSQITAPSPLGSKGCTPLSQAGFKRTVAGKGQQLTLLSVEVHADSRGNLLPDPRYDAVKAIVLSVMDDDEEVPDGQFTTRILLCDQPAQQPAPAQPAAGADPVPALAQQPGPAPIAAAIPSDLPGAGRAPGAAASPVPARASSSGGEDGFAGGRPNAAPGQPPAVTGAGAAGAQQPSPESRTAGLSMPQPPPGTQLPGGGPGPPPLASTASQRAPYFFQGPPAAQRVHGEGQPQATASSPGFGGFWPGGPPAAEGGRAGHGSETLLLRNPAAVDALGDVQVDLYPSEPALLAAFTDAVRALDPDIVVGFEVQKASLGYLADRAAELGAKPSLLRAASRLPEVGSVKEEAEDEYGWLMASGVHLPGRIVLNVWRLMKSDVKLQIYTLENCAAAVLKLRVPHVAQRQLAAWFSQGPAGGRWRCLGYYVQRARLNLALMDQLDLVGRTGELARTFGIDFFSVISRGSQYRVESMMLRLAHTQNYIAVSFSKEQVFSQAAMENIPLVMEPASRLYTDPLVVLDFQSLYPSMIIAYNLCFSTCMGRPAHAAAAAAGPPPAGGAAPAPKLGCGEFALPPGTLRGGLAPDQLIISPNGVAFAPPSVRPGVLPRLLREILETRIMVKGAMKRTPSSAKVLLRCFNARQFGLKLIANVTYGYTAAGFSGRMPMAELADAIVQSGRETLENAIRMVDAHPDWRARVVYGDTDSLFVLLPGRSREEAFRIGNEIAQAVTAVNPPPVTLKMEKVYHPCVLLSKKRYVGFMYESPAQREPAFDAKGIETVRRDTVPAVAKMLEKTLRLLFTSRDLSKVKAYLEAQWTKILAGRVSIQDFVFAKEVRLGTYSAKAHNIPPAALIATRAMAADPRAEPRFGERVPYVVVHGPQGARLRDMAVPPHELTESGGRLRLNANYYILKQIIPALERALSLVGADLRAWFDALPRPTRTLPQKRPVDSLPLVAAAGSTGVAAVAAAAAAVHPALFRPSGGLGGRGSRAATIDRYYLSRHCAVCDELTHESKPLCPRCLARPQLATAVLASRWNRLERQYAQLVRICHHCGGGGGRNTAEGAIVCDSLDCGVYFERRKVWFELLNARALAEKGGEILEAE